jgi:hypothetical protein
MSRRRRERALAPRPPDPLDRPRALARFGSLVGRGVTFGFVLCGPILQGENPERLAEAFAEWLKVAGPKS